MPKYVLTIQITSDESDDISARSNARRILDSMQMLGEGGRLLLSTNETVRLQEVFADKPPRKVAIDT